MPYGMNHQEEDEFERDLRASAAEAKRVMRFSGRYFLGMLAADGAYRTTVTLLSKKNSSDGFDELSLAKRLDLSVEAQVVETKWRTYFDPVLVKKAEDLLSKHEYKYSPFVASLEAPSATTQIVTTYEIDGAPNSSDDEKEPPQRTISTITTFPRDSDVVKKVKSRAINGECECCGEQGFLTDRGGYYLEVHHVIPLSCGGLDVEWNALAICPEDHKRAHFGADRIVLRDELIQHLGERYPEKLIQLLEMARKMDSRASSAEDLESKVEL